MYASPSHIERIFAERYGDISQLNIESTEQFGSSVRGKLGTIVATISGKFSGSVSTSEIRKINFDDEFRQTKQVVNDLLEDDTIPSVTELFGAREASGIYRFASEVALHSDESEFDDDNYIEVVGYEGNVKFRGTTSLDNWGSRSHLLNAMKAMKSEDTYPFQGVLTPVSRETSLPEQDEYRVQYLFICAPDDEQRDRWNNRQRLREEYFE